MLDRDFGTFELMILILKRLECFAASLGVFERFKLPSDCFDTLCI
jgi:hypothetical protein